MTMKYTEATTATQVVTTELNALADDAAAVGSALSNDASTERNTLANFQIVLALQGSARDASSQVSLLIVPEVGTSTYGDTSTLKTARHCIARDSAGRAMTFELDAATTARTLTLQNVVIPNANYKVGLLNESGYALAGSGNSISMTGAFGFTNV